MSEHGWECLIYGCDRSITRPIIPDEDVVLDVHIAQQARETFEGFLLLIVAKDNDNDHL